MRTQNYYDLFLLTILEILLHQITIQENATDPITKWYCWDIETRWWDSRREKNLTANARTSWFLWFIANERSKPRWGGFCCLYTFLYLLCLPFLLLLSLSLPLYFPSSPFRLSLSSHWAPPSCTNTFCGPRLALLRYNARVDSDPKDIWAICFGSRRVWRRTRSKGGKRRRQRWEGVNGWR